MKLFILKTCVFILLLLCCAALLTSFVPYYWGNKWYAAKITFLKQKNNTLPNTFFFGSSRTYRQVNATYFDSLVNADKKDTVQSFNLGAPATFCPQTYYLLRHFLNSEEAANCAVIFMELMPVNRISDHLMHQDRTVYWQNSKDTHFAFSSFWNSTTLAKRQRTSAFQDYSVSYAESLFQPAKIKQAIIRESLANPLLVGPKGDGYFPLDIELATTTNAIVKKNMLQRKNKFGKSHKGLQNRATHAIHLHNTNGQRFDSVNLQEILQLIKKCKEKKIELIFVVPPRVFDKETVTLAKQVPANNVIDLSNAAQYPELFLPENSFDIGHLNSVGANLFTELLAQQFLVFRKAQE